MRAIEWAQSKQDTSLLLRGSELNKAEQWLLQASGGKEPRPTELQANYIAASRERATQEQERTTRRQRMTVGALSGLLLLASGAGTWAWVQQQKALKGEVNANVLADSLAMEAYLQSGLEEVAVTQAVRTGQELEGKNANRINPDTRFRAIASIREVMYGVKERQRLIGHSDQVWGVAFSPGGEMIATASGDNTVKLWSREGQELQTLTGHSLTVWSVAFSPDGQTIATASRDQTVKLWHFELETLITRGCNWLATYFIKQSPDLLMELETCQQIDPTLTAKAAPMLVKKGEALARDGKTKAAIALLQEAIAWDSNLDFDPRERAKTVAAANGLVTAAETLAKAGDIAAAAVKFTKAKELDPSLDFEPETHAKELAVQGYLDEGNQFLNEGKVQDAIQAYRQAEALNLKDSISASDWNTLCWGGSTYNQAKAVMFACEKAVALASDDGNITDSRGLARALTGDTQGAIADFKIYADSTSNEEEKAQRQAWIAALERGENPFTPEVLESLR